MKVKKDSLLTEIEILSTENEFYDLYGDMLEYENSLSPKDHPENPLSNEDYEDGKIQWVLEAQVAKIREAVEGVENPYRKLEEANKGVIEREHHYSVLGDAFDVGVLVILKVLGSNSE